MDPKNAVRLLVWMVVCLVWTFVARIAFWHFFTDVMAVIITFTILYTAYKNDGPYA